MVALREHRYVGEALTRLAGALESLDFGPRSPELASERDRLAQALRSYLIPRVIDPAMPVTVVVAGPTGSGKSTLVNSLAGTDLSATGALRPTTRVPVVVASSGQTHRYETIGGISCKVVAIDAPGLAGMALVDAPDIDSTSTRHRAMAERLIDNADVVIFVTSALRYADQVPWQVLRRAVSRGTPVINVLNRVGSASAGATVDFRSRLVAEGFDDGLTTVPEHHLAGAAHVPSLAVRSLRRRLKAVVSDHEVFAREVFARVLRSTLTQVEDLLGAITEIHDEIDGLEAGVSLDLVARVPHLELSDIARGDYPAPPGGRGAFALRRWRARARRHADGSSVEEAVIERLVAVIEEDVRRWLIAERDSLRQHGVDHRRVLDGARIVGRSAGEGWIQFVARIAADHDERDLWLCEAVLLEAAVTERLPGAADLLFGDEGPALAERARGELVGRLEVVFEQVGVWVAEDLRALHGDIDGSELRASLGAAISTLAPIYA